MPNRQRHFQSLTAQFEFLLQTLSECHEAGLRRDFLKRLKLIVDGAYEIEFGESPSPESDHPHADLDALVH